MFQMLHYDAIFIYGGGLTDNLYLNRSWIRLLALIAKGCTRIITLIENLARLAQYHAAVAKHFLSCLVWGQLITICNKLRRVIIKVYSWAGSIYSFTVDTNYNLCTQQYIEIIMLLSASQIIWDIFMHIYFKLV